MTHEDAAETLRSMYRNAPPGSRAVQATLFGVQYADELDRLDLAQIIERSGIPKGYLPGIRIGIQLADFVQVR